MTRLLEKCLSYIDEEEVLALVKQLVGIQSFPPDFNERDVAVAVAEKFEEYDIPAFIDDLGNNRGNLRAAVGTGTRRHLMLCGHFDTVPPLSEGWLSDPFEAEIRKGRMYGRGTCDMKGGVAALVLSMCYLQKAGIVLNGTLSFLGTAGEETELDGALAFMDEHGVDDISGILIAEASNKEVYVTQMGTYWVELESKGISAHPGVSWQGVNALLNTIKFIEKFRHYDFGVAEHPLLGKPTLNITTMHAGEISNALPVNCKSTIDIRTTPGVDHDEITAAIEKIIKELETEEDTFNLTYRVRFNHPSTETALDDPLCLAAFEASKAVFSKEVKAAGTFFGTDACVMKKSDGTFPPLIIYGPGDPTNNHKVNEFVEISDLLDSIRFYLALILEYFDVQEMSFI
ncbi:peptidase M20 [Enterococcus florum]|uniref:Probable succinyl-diaminopimelate desuccinylase n=1 Tax=Enterococcus florum TaxID=2480627 RepID=A0A4P5PT04_9ENTE|nr:M20 family metallopeptidase [Enterococcus florum]GCF95713.1 peptidase M20 [Enterococcus florum]